VSYSHVTRKSGTLSRPWINHRATVRYQCPPATSGKVALRKDQEFQQAWVLDLSTGGIGLELGRPIPIGTHVVVQLKSSTTRKKYELHAQVARCKPKPTGEFIVGCELLTALSEEDLDALL
jgi:hypothetical protein